MGKTQKMFHFDFVKYMGKARLVSLVLFILSLGFVVFNFSSVLGIDFKGGYLQQVDFSDAVEVAGLRSFLTENTNSYHLQEIADKESMFILKVSFEDKTALQQALELYTDQENLEMEIVREEFVGPSIGKELGEKGLLALIFSLLIILIYLSFRFEFIFSIGAIVALFHDIMICVGVFTFLGHEISLQTLAALLTIVGYSLNDTIILFDRIREVSSRVQQHFFEKDVNKAICATLSRTLLTSLTTFLVVFILFIFGGELISSFALLLLIGVFVGTYSSVFIASNVVLLFKKKLGKV